MLLHRKMVDRWWIESIASTRSRLYPGEITTECSTGSLSTFLSTRRGAMAVKRFSAGYPGVRYREHPKRKHGVRRDRYFSIFYWLNGRKIEEGLGWASEGMTAEKAAGERLKLKEARRLGQPTAHTMREKRKEEHERREEEQRRKDQEQKDAVTFGLIFRDFYYPHAKTDKSERSWKREEQLFRLWAEPVIGRLTLKQIAESDLCFQRIRKNMVEGLRANEQLSDKMTTVKKEKDRQAPASPRSIHCGRPARRPRFRPCADLQNRPSDRPHPVGGLTPGQGSPPKAADEPSAFAGLPLNPSFR